MCQQCRVRQLIQNYTMYTCLLQCKGSVYLKSKRVLLFAFHRRGAVHYLDELSIFVGTFFVISASLHFEKSAFISQILPVGPIMMVIKRVERLENICVLVHQAVHFTLWQIRQL